MSAEELWAGGQVGVPPHRDRVVKRSAPIRRTTPLRNRGRINQRSTKRVERDREYVDIREQVAQRYWCEANIYGVCLPGQHRGDHAHHRVLVGRGGPDELANLIWVCSVAHAHIHANPRWATEHGLMASRG